VCRVAAGDGVANNALLLRHGGLSAGHDSCRAQSLDFWLMAVGAT